MKDEKNKSFDIPPLVIYLTIFLLVLIIVLPPALRALLPEEEGEVELPQDRVALLKCSTTQDSEDYIVDIEVRANYLNEMLSKMVLTYVLTMKETAPIDFIPDLGLSGYHELNDVSVEEIEETTKITINANAFVTNPSNVLLNQYHYPLNEQQQSFETLGYVCGVTSS